MQNITHTLAHTLAFCGAFLLAQPAAATEPSRPVIELYTSQGCSSCPPADKVQAKLAQRDDVIALTLPVDYWDYLGWADTLASPAHTARQRQWREALGLRGIYTPQMVIGGTHDLVGSDQDGVAAALAAVAAQPAILRLEMADSRQLRVMGAAPAACVLTLFRIGRDQVVEVRRGENHGEALEYRNPVRAIEPLGPCATMRLPERHVDDAAWAVVASHGAIGPQLGSGFWRY